ncbi:hypothetical protein GCM10009734_25140 [Nonomuraea bangladeshensis]
MDEQLPGREALPGRRHEGHAHRGGQLAQDEPELAEELKISTTAPVTDKAPPKYRAAAVPCGWAGSHRVASLSDGHQSQLSVSYTGSVCRSGKEGEVCSAGLHRILPSPSSVAARLWTAIPRYVNIRSVDEDRQWERAS